jgi:hypothetical protein
MSTPNSHGYSATTSNDARGANAWARQERLQSGASSTTQRHRMATYPAAAIKRSPRGLRRARFSKEVRSVSQGDRKRADCGDFARRPQRGWSAQVDSGYSQRMQG